MSRKRSAAPLQLGLLVAAILVASCRGGPDEPEAGETALGVVSTDPAALAASATAPEDSEATVGPTTTAGDVPSLTLGDEGWQQVDALLGWEQQTDQSLLRWEERADRLNADREEYVARCMRAEGFEYVAEDVSYASGVTIDPERPDGSVEWTQRYGFGLTTLTFPLDMVGRDGVGFDWNWEDYAPDYDPNDPNISYYESLDLVTQEAYDNAYSGVIGEPGGCQQQAVDGHPDQSNVLMRQFGDHLAEIDERVYSDAAFVRLVAEVDECMGIGGFTFEGLDQFEVQLGTQMDQLMSDPETVIPGSEEWQEGLVVVQTLERSVAVEFDRCIGADRWHLQVEDIARPYRQVLLEENWAVIGSAVDQLSEP